jgi:predicted nucleotidyltransferase
MHLVEKTRQGSKVRKRYVVAKTPYQCVLASFEVDERTKTKLTQSYLGLTPRCSSGRSPDARIGS